MKREIGTYKSADTKTVYKLRQNDDEAMIVRRDEYVFVQVKSQGLAKLYLFKGNKLLIKNLIYTFALTKEQMEHDLEFCVKEYEQDMEELKRISEQWEKEEKERIEKNEKKGIMVDEHHGGILKIPPKQ